MEFTQLQTLDYLVIAGYFLVIIATGLYFGRYIRRAKDYFTAGANIPWWLAAISFWMATFSSLSFVTYAELGYKYGLTALTLYCVGAPCMVVGAYFFVGRWRRARQISPIGFIGARFSPALREVFVWTGFPLRMVDNAIRIYATAVFLVAALSGAGLSMTQVICLTGGVALAYSLLGGQWSVIVTDFVQFVILCLAVFLLFPLSVRAVDGFGAFFEHMPEGFMRPLSPPYDLYQLLTWIVLVFFSFHAGWSMIQKYNCVASERDARRVVYAVAVWSIIGPIVFYTPSMIARVLYPQLENPRFAYAAVSLGLLPVGLMGVMMAAIFSATLSTLSNEFTMLSSVLTNDFYAKKIDSAASETKLVRVGRFNALIIGALTVLIAVALQYVKGMNLFDIMVKAYTAFAPAIMVPMLGGILFRRLTARGALAGIVSGFISGSVLLLLNIALVAAYREHFLENPRLNYWLNQGWSSTSILINFGVSALGCIIGSVAGETSAEERKRIGDFFALLETPYVSEKRETGESPFPVVGLVIAVMGLGLLAVSAGVWFLYHRADWFFLNFGAAMFLLVVGAVIRFLSRRRR